MQKPAHKHAFSPRRVFVADSGEWSRRALCRLIEHESDLLVCGQSQDAAGLPDEIELSHPDVAVIDLEIRNSNGLEIISRLHQKFPALSLLVISLSEGSLQRDRVLKAGAAGYLDKTEAARAIVPAIRKTLIDRKSSDKSVTRRPAC